MSETASLVADLERARETFQRMDGKKSIPAAHRLACHRSPIALASLVALRKELPAPYGDFASFESSRHWRVKDAYAVFDRAIALAKTGATP